MNVFKSFVFFSSTSLCCCPPVILNLFKPVNHDCPKCNKRIAKYNRFGLNFKSNINIFNENEEASATPSISEEPSVENKNNNSNNNNKTTDTYNSSTKSSLNGDVFSPMVSPTKKNKSKSTKNNVTTSKNNLR